MNCDFKHTRAYLSSENDNCNETGDCNPLILNLGVTTKILSFEYSLTVAKRYEKHSPTKILPV